MPLLPLILIIISAVTHSSWNIMCKSDRPSASFFLLSLGITVILLSPVFLLPEARALLSENALWMFILPSGFFQALYLVSLGNAYRHNEISLVYPMARSLPVLFVPLANFLLFGQTVKVPALFGMVTITAGCFILPLGSGRSQYKRIIISPGSFWIYLTALGTTGYTLVDSRALTTLGELQPGMGRMFLAIAYMASQGFAILLFIMPYILTVARERDTLMIIIGTRIRKALGAGFFLTLSYLLVLRAMAESVNVSYVAALRQISIPLGAALGFIILKEKPIMIKLMGILLVFTGLIITGLN